MLKILFWTSKFKEAQAVIDYIIVLPYLLS